MRSGASFRLARLAALKRASIYTGTTSWHRRLYQDSARGHRSVMSSSSDAPASAPAERPDPVAAEEAKTTESAAESATETAAAESEPAALPPMTPAEFKEYNRLAEHMDLFHNHFRQTWTMLYNACLNNRRPGSMTLRQFVDEGLHFVRMLTAHHDIEETYFFPLLAARMPEFRPAGKGGGGNRRAAELLQQHKEIHAGMDGFEDYLRRCRNRELDFELSVLKEKMDTWGDVLWKHLDQEVKTLGAENMRKYWSLDELRKMPI